MRNKPCSTGHERGVLGLVRTPEDKRDLAGVAQAIQDTARAWAMVERELQKHPFIGGETFTLCDIPWGVHAHRWFSINYLGLERPEFPGFGRGTTVFAKGRPISFTLSAVRSPDRFPIQ